MTKKITFIDQYSTMGGGQTVLLQLIQIFLNKKFQVTVLAPMGGELEKRLESEFGDKVRRLHLPELKLTQGSKNIFDLLKLAASPLKLIPHLGVLKQSDIVYVNGARYFAAWWLLNKKIKVRSVFHIHLDFSKLEKKLISKIAHDPNSTLICISDYVYKSLLSFDPPLSKRKNIKIIENTLTSEYSTQPFTFRVSETKNVAIIGRISREKGQEIVVEVAKTFPDLQFYLIGASDFANNDFEAELRANAGTNVTFTGKVDDLKLVLDECKIQVSIVPSKWEEPFGLTAIESMALSCFTIVSSRGELPNIAKKTGALVFNDKTDLARKIENVTRLPLDHLKNSIEDQYKKTQEHYSFTKYEKQISELFS